MKRLVEMIVDYLVSKECIETEMREVYYYGFDLLIYTIISTIGILVIGFFFCRPLEVLILIIVFYKNQSQGGGFHAESHIKCFTYMSLGTIIYCIVLSISFPIMIDTILIAVSGYILWRYAVVLHPNKAYLAPNKINMLQKSRRLFCYEYVLLMILVIAEVYLLKKCLLYSLTLCALSRFCAVKFGKGTILVNRVSN